MDKKDRQQAGFTLIELLAVMAIIGLLSAIILANLNTARIKSRDSRRIQDLRQIANVVALREDNSVPVPFTGCTTAGAAAYTCTGNGPDLSAYRDPTASSIPCTPSSADTCDYAVFVMTGSTYPPTTHNWKVCAYLEAGPPLRQNPGLIRIETGGSLVAGC